MKKTLLSGLFLLGIFFCLLGTKSKAYAEEVPVLDSIPRVEFVTENGNGLSLTKPMGYVNTSIKIVDGEEIVVEDTQGLVKVRGNSTADAAKKPYTFKLSSKTNLFGMGKAKKWILLANAFDPTLIRNAVALELAKSFNKMYYTSEFRYVEVWMDGRFLGNYMLVEQVESGSSRVDIETDRTKEGYCGEFLVQYEESRTDADSSYVVTDIYKYRFEVKEPEEPTEEELENIAAVLNQIEYCFANRSGDNDAFLFNKYLDKKSFIDCYIFNEYCKTFDFLTTSVYFYYKVTDGRGRLYAGPVWDYDLSMGNVSQTYRNAQLNRYINYYTSRESYQGFYANSGPLFDQLCTYESFGKDVKKRYGEVQPAISSIYKSGGYIDRLLNEYGESFERNFDEAGWDVTRQYFEFMMKPLSTYEANVNYLRKWLINRDLWLSNNFGIVEDTLIYHSEVPATCILTGTKEHYENPVSGKLFWDAAAQNEIEDLSQLDIPRVDHSFGEYIYNEDATCFNDGTETATCTLGCSTTKTRTKVGSKHDHSFTNFVENNDGSCLTDSTKTAECDYGCGASKTVLSEKATGHQIEKTFVPASVGNSKNKAGYIVTKCKLCKEEQYSLKIPAVKTITVEGLSSGNLVYTGKTLRPEITILDTDKDDLDSKFYTLKYINSKAVGKAGVEISFKGYYSGTIVKTYNIIPQNNLKLTLTNNAKGIDVSWKADSKITGYQIQIATDKKFSAGLKTYTIKDYKTKNKVITGLKNKTTYYFRIRNYKTVDKVNYYSNWSAAYKLKRTTTSK